jgi:hypothetical protein
VVQLFLVDPEDQFLLDPVDLVDQYHLEDLEDQLNLADLEDQLIQQFLAVLVDPEDQFLLDLVVLADH